MKSITLISVFMAFSLNALCQGAFTEKTYNELKAKSANDPVAFLKTDADENFVFIDGNGKRRSKSEVMASASTNNETRKNSDLKISQSNKTVVVTGLVEQITSLKNAPNQIRKYKGMFSYVYAYKQNKWMIMSAQHSDYQPSKEEDEAAIKKVIQDETDGYYEGNFDKANGQWSTKLSNEYQNQYIAQFVGKPYAKSENLQKLFEFAKKASQKQEVTVDESDFELRLNKNMAWATYNQKVTKKDGVVMQNQRQTRILERINGDWKIVFVSGQDIK